MVRFIKVALFVTAIASLYLIAMPVQALTPVKLEVSFSKLFYEPTDTITAKIKVSNPSNRPLTDIRVKFSVGNPNHPKFTTTWYQSLLNNTSEFDLKRKAQSLDLSEGSYPISIEVSEFQNNIKNYNTTIAIVRQNQEKLNLGLALNMAEKPVIDPSFKFINQDLFQSDLNKIQNYLQVLNKSKGKTSLIISPLLLDEIINAGNGFAIKTKGSEQQLSIDSPQALKARVTLASLNTFFRNRKSELISTTYSAAPIDVIAKNNLQESFQTQEKKGFSVLSSFFRPTEKLGFFPTDSIIDQKSFGQLKNRYGYVLVNNRILPGYFKADRYQKTKILSTDTEANEALKSSNNSQAAVAKLIGRLAEIYSQNTKDSKTLVLTPDLKLKPETLSVFLKTIANLNWIKFESINGMQTKKINHLKIMTIKRPFNHLYLSKLKKAFKLFSLLKKATDRNSLAREKISTDFLIAEDASFLMPKQSKDRLFLDYVEAAVKKELSQIQIQASAITLTSESGKIPVSVINRANYNFYATLFLTSPALKIKNNFQKIKIRPGENLYVFFTKALTSTTAQVSVSLKANGKILKKQIFPVKTTTASSYMGWILTIILIFLIIFLIAVFIRERNYRRSTD